MSNVSTPSNIVSQLEEGVAYIVKLKANSIKKLDEDELYNTLHRAYYINLAVSKFINEETNGQKDKQKKRDIITALLYIFTQSPIFSDVYEALCSYTVSKLTYDFPNVAALTYGFLNTSCNGMFFKDAAKLHKEFNRSGSYYDSWIKYNIEFDQELVYQLQKIIAKAQTDADAVFNHQEDFTLIEKE